MHLRPSELLNLAEWSAELTGLPGKDLWTCWQFDQAVLLFGHHIDALIAKATYTKGLSPQEELEEFLGLSKRLAQRGGAAQLLALFGGLKGAVSTVISRRK